MYLIHEHLAEAARLFPMGAAVICDGRKTTYREFLKSAELLRLRLKDSGLKKGQCVFILLRDKTDFLTALCSVLSSGAVAVPLTAEISDSDLNLAAESYRPALIITKSKDSAGLSDWELEDWQGPLDAVTELENIQEESSTEGMKGAELTSNDIYSNSPYVGPDDPALILHEWPDHVMGRELRLSHGTLSHYVRNLNEFMDVSGKISEYVSAPLYQPFGLSRSLCILSAGGTLLVTNKVFDAPKALHEVLTNRCDSMAILPEEFQEISQQNRETLEELHSSLKFIQIGSSIAGDQRKMIHNSFKPTGICVNHGLTPTSRSTTIDFRKFQPEGKDSGNGGFVIAQNLTGEIESKIRNVYPDCELYVINVPAESGSAGEIPVLCYLSKKGKSITLSELAETLSGYFDKNQIPKIVYRFDRFPKTQDKALVRRELQIQVLNGAMGTTSLKKRGRRP